MPYIPPEVVEKAREMDLLTYLKSYEPQELVHFGGNTYCTREHDSLKISNGKWCWFSRGIGGYSALDYLIKVKEMPFMQAVETIMGNVAVSPPTFTPAPNKPKEKVLLLPKANRCATHAVEYLHGRGIDYELIDFCISTGRLYESYPYHNVVFVGQDRNGKARYANLRGIGSDFIGDANGSDKHYSFGIPAVLYGIGTGDGEIVAVALSQIGNVGGEPYWSWYGFNSRVEWCACFVSWCANECGYIDAGVIPKFAGCVIGSGWFKDRGLWQDRSYEPRPGDIIFFDWDNKGSSGPQDGESDHVGIVEKVKNGIVYTVEGNSGDSCRENYYAVGHYEILGYGVPQY